MKKLFSPLLIFFLFFPLIPNVYASLSGCNPAVSCKDVSKDYYSQYDSATGKKVSACYPRIQTVNDCTSATGYTLKGKEVWAFDCSANGNGCYVTIVSNPECPNGIKFGTKCLTKLNVLSDTKPNGPITGEEAYKLYDGTTLTELVHVDTSGCPDKDIAVSDTNSPTGWACAKPSTALAASLACEKDQIAVADKTVPAGWKCATPSAALATSLNCANDQIAVADNTVAAKWKCTTATSFVSGSSLEDAANGIVSVLNKIMTKLGAAADNVTAIVNALNNLIAGGTSDQITQYQQALNTALNNFAINISGAGGGSAVYVGKTSDPSGYDGNRGGYAAANNLCKSSATPALNGSHICTADEMIHSSNNSVPALTSLKESVWINAGPPGYTSNVANDCSGWKSPAGKIKGYIWDGVEGSSFISPCSQKRNYACCK